MSEKEKDHGKWVLHWVSVTCRTKYGYGDMVERLFWDGMEFEMRHKWGWYFRYRECLMQVKYPRYYVEMAWGNYEPKEVDEVERVRVNKLRHRRGKVTEIERKLEMARREWDGLFPIEEDVVYRRAVLKLEEVRRQRDVLEKGAG